MIKEKLMKALKKAAADYNGGMSADAAVAKAAEEADFNEKQAERLAEMFNTLAVLNKERDKDDPTGTCELACKEAVAKMLIDGCSGNSEKKASAAADYSFYFGTPEKTNATIEARKSGISSFVKAASAAEDAEPDELKVSQRSLYKVIEGKIDLLKQAAASADDVVRQTALEAERIMVKVAKEIESPFANPEAADMFKAACPHEKALAGIAEYSTKVAESDGGRFAKMEVFDSSIVDSLVKDAEEIERGLGMVAEFERKRDFYLQKAAEAEREVWEAVSLVPRKRSESLADMFCGVAKQAFAVDDGASQPEGPSEDIHSMLGKLAEVACVPEDLSGKAKEIFDELEKSAAKPVAMLMPMPSVEDVHGALTKQPGIDNERKRVMNARRGVLLADLMTNDPIIRDADPEVVVEAYKTMVMSSPRVSLDKSQVRAFLRTAVNSVAISPADAKIVTDVDRGMSMANVEGLGRLSMLDSSIKDSNS